MTLWVFISMPMKCMLDLVISKIPLLLKNYLSVEKLTLYLNLRKSSVARHRTVRLQSPMIPFACLAT